MRGSSWNIADRVFGNCLVFKREESFRTRKENFLELFVENCFEVDWGKSRIGVMNL